MRRQRCTEAGAAGGGGGHGGGGFGGHGGHGGHTGMAARSHGHRGTSQTAGGVGAGAPLLTGSRGQPWTGRKQTAARLVIGLLLAAVVLIIILAAVGVL